MQKPQLNWKSHNINAKASKELQNQFSSNLQQDKLALIDVDMKWWKLYRVLIA